MVWVMVGAGLGGGVAAAAPLGASNENSKPLRAVISLAARSICICICRVEVAPWDLM